MLSLLLLRAALLLAPQEPESAPPAAAVPSDEAGLTTLLVERNDEADPELVRRLANMKTAAAASGLVRFYDAVSSLYMRRIALHGFALFDGVPEAEPTAFQKLVDIATLSLEPELRDSAIDELGGCNGGRPYLAAIVSSAADDAARERALRQHVAGARPEDADWYLRIYRSGEKDKDKKKDKERDKEKREKGDKGEKGDKPPEALFTPPLRELAFEGLAATRASDELVEATESKLVAVRRRALEELAARRDPKTGECAEHMFERNEERPDVRLMAAQILLEERGQKFAEQLYKDARRGAVPLELAFGIADLLMGLDDAGLRAQALKNLTGGHPAEKRFHLRMAARIPDPKVDKALLELAKDKDAAVVADALRAMGVRGNPTFVPRLEQALEDSSDPRILGVTIDSLILIRGSDEKWRAELIKLAAHAVDVVRNSAVEALGRTHDTSYLPAVLQALQHASWSTRMAAARALAELHTTEGVAALCERIGQEEGRMAIELADILFQLTGQPFRGDAGQWKRWWDKEGATFRFPTPEEVQKRAQERNLREEKQASKSFRGVKVDSRFFGLRIESHHVAFVIDVSGSMEEKLPTGQKVEQVPTRIEVARKELLACLEALEAGTRFNILPFSGGVTPWKEAAVEATEASFAEAKKFVQELGAFGGTNIHDGLHQAFLDETVDTIFFLSDGEPSVGEVVDPVGIREAVQAWNKERGVVIHTISIGDRFPLLEWLATDSGGSYRTYP